MEAILQWALSVPEEEEEKVCISVLRALACELHHLCSQDEPLDDAVLVRVCVCLRSACLGMMPIVCSGNGPKVGSSREKGVGR